MRPDVAPVPMDMVSEQPDCDSRAMSLTGSGPQSPMAAGSPVGSSEMPVSPDRRTTSSPHGRSRTKRLLAKFKVAPGSTTEADDNALFGRKSWRSRTPRTPLALSLRKAPSLFRNCSSFPKSPQRATPAPVLPATLIAPPDELECLVKQAIETEQGIDAKRLFKSLVIIENLQM